MNIYELKNLDTSKIEDLQKAVDIINDSIVVGDPGYAQEALLFLNDLLSAKGQEILAKFPDLYDQLEKLWTLCGFHSILGLDQVDQENLFKTKIYEAIKLGFDPDTITKNYFEYFESDDLIKQYFMSFLKALSQNTEQLGTIPVEMGGKKLLPTIKYWIEDYAKFPSKVAKRGSVERLNYINQSVNARSLNQILKQQLLKILKLYDDLNNVDRPLNKRGGVNIDSYADRSASDIKAPQNLPVSNMPEPKIDIQKKLNELKDRVR